MQRFVSVLHIVLHRAEQSGVGWLSPPPTVGDGARQGLKSLMHAGWR